MKKQEKLEDLSWKEFPWVTKRDLPLVKGSRPTLCQYLYCPGSARLDGGIEERWMHTYCGGRSPNVKDGLAGETQELYLVLKLWLDQMIHPNFVRPNPTRDREWMAEYILHRVCTIFFKRIIQSEDGKCS